MNHPLASNYSRRSGELGCLRGIPDHKVESAGRDFAEAGVPIEGYGYADGWILTGELEPTFQ